MSGHTDSVFDCAFSPDGKRVVSVSCDSSVRVWDVSKGRGIGRCVGHNNVVKYVCWSADGRYIVSSCIGSGILIHDAVTYAKAEVFTGIGSVTCALSPDSKLIAGDTDSYSSGHCAAAKIWDMKTKKEIFSSGKYEDSIESVSFSPDGRYFMYSADSNDIRVVNIANKKWVRIFVCYDGEWIAYNCDGYYSVSPNGSRLVSQASSEVKLSPENNRPDKVMEL